MNLSNKQKKYIESQFIRNQQKLLLSNQVSDMMKNMNLDSDKEQVVKEYLVWLFKQNNPNDDVLEPYYLEKKEINVLNEKEAEKENCEPEMKTSDILAENHLEVNISDDSYSEYQNSMRRLLAANHFCLPYEMELKRIYQQNKNYYDRKSITVRKMKIMLLKMYAEYQQQLSDTETTDYEPKYTEQGLRKFINMAPGERPSEAYLYNFIVNNGTKRRVVDIQAEIDAILSEEIIQLIAEKDPEKAQKNKSLRMKSKQYLHLIEAWEKLGKNLTDTRLGDLITANHYDQMYGLSVYDVRQDIEALKRKTMVGAKNTSVNPSRRKIEPQKEPSRVSPTERSNIPNNEKKPDNRIPKPKVLETYDEYFRLLSVVVRQNNFHELTNIQIENFIRKFDLDEDYGIDTTIINRDMKIIIMKNHVKDILEDSGDDGIDLNEEDDFSENINGDNFAKYVKEFSKMLRRYPEFLSDGKRLENALNDIMVGMRKEINAIVELFNKGIVEDITESDFIDSNFRDKYASILISNLGIQKSLAKRMTLFWIIAYAQDVLEKPIDIEHL